MINIRRESNDKIQEQQRIELMRQRNKEFQRINKTASEDKRLVRQCAKRKQENKEKIDQICKEIIRKNKDFREADIDITNQLKLVQKRQDSTRDYGLENVSMKMIDNSMAYQLADTLNKAGNDIKSIPIQQELVQNQAIRNLSSIHSIIVEAKQKMSDKIKAPQIFQFDRHPIFSTPQQSNGFKDKEQIFKNQFIVKKKKKKEFDAKKIRKQQLQPEYYFSDCIKDSSDDEFENQKTSRNRRITSSSRQYIDSSRDTLLLNHLVLRANFQRQISNRKYLLKMNDSFIEPLKQMTIQSLKGQINPDNEQMRSLQNSLGVLTLFQGIKKRTNNVQLYSYNDERNFYGYPQKSTKKQNIVQTMINKDEGIGSTFQDDIYYILSNQQQIINYLDNDNS